jgi:hypothetical protein
MASLPASVSLHALARILIGAQVLNHDAWDGISGSIPSESQLSGDIRDLLKLLRDRGTPYLLVGGIALLKYIEGRNTEDIDLLISVDSLKSLPELVVEDRNPYFARARFKSLRVDLLFTKNPVFKLVAERFATSHRFDQFEVPCATPEGLILLKLYALPPLYKQGNMQRAALYETDITTLVYLQSPKLDPLLSLLDKHLTPGEMTDLRGIIAEINQRVERMRRSQPS